MEANAVTIGVPIAALIAAGIAVWYVSWAHRRFQKEKEESRKQASRGN